MPENEIKRNHIRYLVSNKYNFQEKKVRGRRRVMDSNKILIKNSGIPRDLTKRNLRKVTVNSIKNTRYSIGKDQLMYKIKIILLVISSFSQKIKLIKK